MNIWKISVENIKSKPLYTLLSVFMLALSIALLLGIQQLKTSFKYQMENNLGDIDLVIGAKGSPLQLVLSSVLHLDNPTGNIPFKEANKFGRNPMIKKAVPISYGDNYKGFRIVGTAPEFMTFYEAEIENGRQVQKSLEVILGHMVAEQLQLKIGDTFLSSHGLVDNDAHVHDDEFTVVGILKPTQKVIDRLIVTNLESIWDVHDHEDHENLDNHEDKEEHEDHEDHDNHGDHQDHTDDEHHDHENHEHNDHEEDKEITSLLISFRNPAALLTLPRRINEDTNMQAALPKYELNKLYEYTGIGFKTISWIAYVILIISGMTIFISLYKMIKERAFDLALLRTYGASNTQLIKMVTYEGLIIICFAFIIGFIFTKAGLYFLFNYLESGYQKTIVQALPISEALQIIGLVFAMIILSISLAIYPIIKMNISTILSNEK
ncbi:FtsX-like permease family protein [Winogradskyella sp.]|uniref:ABC transporter permease n=1 Tax=Winogradskyella sp. TaxID=1883156 RepID=UPI0026061639|nr:FtsX-like permease family protein [Winogradskyella sp.]